MRINAIVVFLCICILNGCGGGGRGQTSLAQTTRPDIPEPAASPTPTPTPTPQRTILPTPDPSIAVTISGVITYDRVPHQQNGALDYDAIRQQAVRDATVQLLNSNGDIVDAGVTDNEGRYSLAAAPATDVRVSVSAELFQTEGPAWNIRVIDNTQSGSLYTLQGELMSSGEADSTRDLNASSGWTGTSYDEDRVAAPFAILDSAYESVQLLLSVDSNIDFGALDLHWSPSNTGIDGDFAIGEIGATHYEDGNIYILGYENEDTDEYDNAVIQHELMHYVEDRFSRSDGSSARTSLTGQYDMRVAFSEGLAIAFAAISSGSEFYKNSFGERQSMGSSFSLENQSNENAGWFSINAIGNVIYDIFDANADDDDDLNLGFAPIFRALTSEGYTQGIARTSIFSFAEALKAELNESQALGLERILHSQDIFGVDEFGRDETNDGGSMIVLPLYQELAPGESINVCSDVTGGIDIGFGVRRLVRLNITHDGTYTIAVTKTSGDTLSDPDVFVFLGSEFVQSLGSEELDEEVGEISLSSESYLLEIFDFTNTLDDEALNGLSCFDVLIIN